MNVYCQMLEGCRLQEGAPRIERPKKDQIQQFESIATQHVNNVYQNQVGLTSMLNSEWLSFFKGKHVLVAGGTGTGLGSAIVNALLHFCLDSKGSVCVLSRDLKQSIEFEVGWCFQKKADALGLSDRFYWSNRGIALEGKFFDELIEFYQSRQIKEIIYINTVASASSGLLPGYPDVYVKDLDEQGFFQWKLAELSQESIQRTKHVMGDLAVNLIGAMKNSSIECELSVFADWRGSLDKLSRHPESPIYGRQGAYSTSLYLPKDVIQQFVHECYLQNNHRAIDIFYPVMQTRALKFIPGGHLMSTVLDALYAKLGRQSVPVWKLAVQTLNCIYQNLQTANDNPFPRLDLEELELELWFNEIMQKINNNKTSPFFYQNWIGKNQG